MSIDKEKILSLLGSGFSHKVVASAVGCTSAYISQLLTQEEFATQLQEKKLSALAVAQNRDALLESLEDKLLAKMESSVEFLYKPSDIISWFDRVHAASRSTAQSAQEGAAVTQVININLPQFLQREISGFRTNNINQVTAVTADGLEVPMITMPTANILAQLAPKGANKNEEIPSTGEGEEGELLAIFDRTL